MSGGAFDYDQYRIEGIKVGIEDCIWNNHKENEWGYARDYPDDIIEEFKNAVRYLELAQIYAQRIDWLISGDDGEENFRKRLLHDLTEVGYERINGEWVKNAWSDGEGR